MVWVWSVPEEFLDFGADYNYVASRPATSREEFAEAPVNPDLRPVFRSRSGLKRFKAMHCPPFHRQPVVDTVWRDIIRQFVPEDRIQFLPVRLIASCELCEDFMYAIPFDRRRCIDARRSNVHDKVEKEDITLIFSVSDIVHHPDCLQGSHMARDPQRITHLVVSDALRDALAATGEDSVFRPSNRVAQ